MDMHDMDHLNISKAKIQREQLINELELYLEQKEINFIKMQPESPIMKDIIEGKSDGFKISDKYATILTIIPGIALSNYMLRMSSSQRCYGVDE